ncbi:MAG: hypothetical protein K0R17_1461 [Rariglobus sp.]|jgi:hypothetical protein|nr:hypothetical protein [Rariglobus sp.]
MPPPLKTVRGAPSWTFASDCVEASLTRDGGHLAPVRFRTERGVVNPFSIAPWSEEPLAPDTAPILKTLRGDFFCAPFGGNARPWRGERHPAHGETATERWDFVGCETTPSGIEFVTRLRTKVRTGEVTKHILLRNGETNLYCRHELKGFSGPLNIGHHAMLAFPEENGPGQILLSPWREGRVCPQPFESPAAGGYSSLKPGAPFRSLTRVPLASGGKADLSRYPAREGFEDIVMVSSRADAPFAWTTVTFPKAGWLWFAIKDPRILASTLLWHSNGGRHYPPWNGRHRRVLGLEEVTSYFHFGLAESAAPNPLSQAGIPTVLRLRGDRVATINYIMGVVALPRGFDRLKSIRLAGNHLLARSTSGTVARHPVDLSFFQTRP